MNKEKHTFIGGNQWLFAIIIFNGKHRWIKKYEQNFSYFFFGFVLLLLRFAVKTLPTNIKSNTLHEKRTEWKFVSHLIASHWFKYIILFWSIELLWSQTLWLRECWENRIKMNQHFRIDHDFRGLVFVFVISKFARYLTHHYLCTYIFLLLLSLK